MFGDSNTQCDLKKLSLKERKRSDSYKLQDSVINVKSWTYPGKGRRKCLTVSLGQTILEVRDRFHESSSRNMDQKVLHS